MPPDCCRVDYDAQFNDEEARRDVLHYRAKGPDPSTQRLVDAIVAQGIQDASLLDIGGGIGAVQLELLKAGVGDSLDVDASGPYLAVARDEAQSGGWGERTRYLHGDFTSLAGEVGPADVVTLDRVICCYPDVLALISLSVARARRLYGLVHPVDRWWTRAIARLGNLGCRLFRNPYRIYVHPQALVDRLVADEDFEPITTHTSWFWRTAVYRRRGAQTSSA